MIEFQDFKDTVLAYKEIFVTTFNEELNDKLEQVYEKIAEEKPEYLEDLDLYLNEVFEEYLEI